MLPQTVQLPFVLLPLLADKRLAVQTMPFKGLTQLVQIGDGQFCLQLAIRLKSAYDVFLDIGILRESTTFEIFKKRRDIFDRADSHDSMAILQELHVIGNASDFGTCQLLENFHFLKGLLHFLKGLH